MPTFNIQITINVETLSLKPTKTTPEVLFAVGNLQLSGESYPEDAPEFYKTLVQWVEAYTHIEYVKLKTNKTKFENKINFFNTASRGFLLEIVSRLNRLYLAGHQVEIIWHYDSDEGIDEDDMNFKDLIDDFKIVVKYIPAI